MRTTQRWTSPSAQPDMFISSDPVFLQHVVSSEMPLIQHRAVKSSRILRCYGANAETASSKRHIVIRADNMSTFSVLIQAHILINNTIFFVFVSLFSCNFFFKFSFFLFSFLSSSNLLQPSSIATIDIRSVCNKYIKVVSTLWSLLFSPRKTTFD